MSLMAGIIGEAKTATGTPASLSRRMASSRRAGDEARDDADGERGERDADGELTLLLEGRELEHLELQSPIPFAAVVQAPALVPENQYRSARRDDAFAV